jgi:hypothetical protein
VGIEAKWADAPAMTRSMHTAVADLKLDTLYVVYPGPQRYRLDRRVEVVPLGELPGILT